MKARSAEFVDRAIAATTAALEIYNKPNFPYKAETFCILAINGWELLFKAKWLQENKNKVQSLYMSDARTKKDGQPRKHAAYKKSARTGVPLTHSLDFLAKQLVKKRHLPPIVETHLEALLEMRNSAIHFHLAHSDIEFIAKLHALAAASVKNFSLVVREWFNRDLDKLDLNLIPLSLINSPRHTKTTALSAKEKNFLRYLMKIQECAGKPTSDHAIMLHIDVKFSKSKEKDATAVRVSADSNAVKVQLSDSQILERYPWDYKRLTEECRRRYKNFQCNKKYHEIRMRLHENEVFCYERLLDPVNSKSTRKRFFNPNILQKFDEHYEKL